MSNRGRPKHPDVLTPREWEVLDLIRAGRSNDEIAARLGISLDGVKYHVSEILGKLGVENRHDAARWAEQGAPRPWWAGAFAPLAFWRRLNLGWISPVVGGGLLLAVAAGVGLLIWGLLATRDGTPSAAVVALPAADRLAYVADDENLWLLEGGGPARRLTDFGAVSRLRWSPDGRYVLFVNDEAKPATPPPIGWEAQYSLWLADAESGEARRLAEGPVDLPEQPWSAGGDRIAYLKPSSEGQTASVWVTGTDGNTRELIPEEFGAWTVAWAPDGRSLAIARNLPLTYPEDWNEPGAHVEIPPENGVYVVDADGGEPRSVVLVEAIQRAWEEGEGLERPEGQPTSLALTGVDSVRWSPDGHYLALQPVTLSASAMADGAALLTVALEGGSPVYHGVMLRSPALLDWFPDGHRFVFTMGGGRDLYIGKRLALADGGVRGAAVIAEDAARIPTPEQTAAVTPPSISVRSDAWPAVSPDGARIAFQASEAAWQTQRLDVGKIEGPNEGIWVVDADGAKPRQLTSDPDALDFFPRWSADGDFILFIRTDGRAFAGDFEGVGSPRAEIWLMRADGSDEKLLIDDLQRIGSYYGLFQWQQELAWHPAP